MSEDLVSLSERGPTEADAVRALISPRKEAVIKKLLELAELGDPRAIETALKYLTPPARPDAERINVPGLREAATIADKSDAILAAVSRGEVSVEAGEKILRMLDLHVRAVTVHDLAEQVEALKRGRAMLPSPAPAPALPAPAGAEFA